MATPGGPSSDLELADPNIWYPPLPIRNSRYVSAAYARISGSELDIMHIIGRSRGRGCRGEAARCGASICTWSLKSVIWQCLRHFWWKMVRQVGGVCVAVFVNSSTKNGPAPSSPVGPWVGPARCAAPFCAGGWRVRGHWCSTGPAIERGARKTYLKRSQTLVVPCF